MDEDEEDVQPATTEYVQPATQIFVSQRKMSQYAIIGGRRVELANTEKVIVDTTTAYNKKEDRNSLDAHKLNDLFMKAVRTSQKKYNFININLDDPDILEDTYNLGMAISRTQVNHSRFDMHDVFSVVDPNNGYTVTDLYKNHSLLTEEEVAISNEFYLTMTNGNDNKWYQQNMSLTYEYFINNVEEGLQTKVLETYLTYPPKQRGGPLFFKIMIDILQNNSSKAAKYLVQKVKDIKITNYAGENVSSVVSLIRGATNRLSNLEDKHGKTEIPEDFVNDIIKIFTTSSNKEFNDIFEYYQRKTKVDEFESGKKAKKMSILSVLKFAEEQYQIFVRIRFLDRSQQENQRNYICS